MGRAAELGDSRWYLISAGVLLGLLLLVRRRIVRVRLREACDWLSGLAAFVLAAVILSGLTVDVLKWLVGRTRPNVLDEGIPYGFDPLQFDASFQSFPSGHANTLFVLALIGAFMLPRLGGALLVLATVLALGRVATSAHYVSDLLGAAAIAVATTFWLRERFADRGWVFAREEAGLSIDRRGRMLSRWLGRRPRRRRRSEARPSAALGDRAQSLGRPSAP
jgi:undecaprenyl-diphosphatase